MESFVPVRLDHSREQLVLTVLARGIADRAFLLAQLLVEAQRVIPLEGREVALVADRSIVHASTLPLVRRVARAQQHEGRHLVAKTCDA